MPVPQNTAVKPRIINVTHTAGQHHQRDRRVQRHHRIAFRERPVGRSESIEHHTNRAKVQSGQHRKRRPRQYDGLYR